MILHSLNVLHIRRVTRCLLPSYSLITINQVTIKCLYIIMEQAWGLILLLTVGVTLCQAVDHTYQWGGDEHEDDDDPKWIMKCGKFSFLCIILCCVLTQALICTYSGRLLRR